jgi:hypothetical protein
MSTRRKGQKIKNAHGLISIPLLQPIDIRCSKEEWTRYRKLVRENRTRILTASHADEKTPNTAISAGWVDEFSLIFDEDDTQSRDLEDFTDFQQDLGNF